MDAIYVAEKPVSEYRPGVHRHAEAGPAGLPALHGHHEHVLDTGAIRWIRMRAPEQDSVEDPHRVQLARPRPEERVPGRRPRWLGYLDEPAPLVDPGPPEADLGWRLVLLPRVRPDRIAEQGLVVPAPESVVAAVLLVGQANRQIRRAADLVIHDRVIANGRTDNRVPVARERGEQLVEPRFLDDVVESHPGRLL